MYKRYNCKVTRVITRVTSSFCASNLMLPACKRKFCKIFLHRTKRLAGLPYTIHQAGQLLPTLLIGRFIISGCLICSRCADICKERSSDGPGSSVGIATDYGLNDPGSNPGGDEIFRLFRPSLGLTQPPVQYNEYRVFPGGKVQSGRAADHSPPSSAAGMEE